MNAYLFYPAAPEEKIVYGSGRPGRPRRPVPVSNDQVEQWVSFMQAQGIRRVCCLLDEVQLANDFEGDLLAYDRAGFGAENVLWAPIRDFHLPDPHILFEVILPFLRVADAQGRPVVVHCSGGVGRTGIVLAAWLVSARGYAVEEALTQVIALHRNPYDAVASGQATRSELVDLLSRGAGAAGCLNKSESG